MPRWPKIYCDRRGFREDCMHTKRQFLRCIWASGEFEEMLEYDKKIRGVPFILPPGKLHPRDVEGWMLYLGARWV